MPWRVSLRSATYISAIQSYALAGLAPNGSGTLSSFGAAEDGTFASVRYPVGEAPVNYQLYSWETFQLVSGLLPHPEWTEWDQTVRYCTLVYQQYIVIASRRPQFRFVGDVAIVSSTGGVWQCRQQFVATSTKIKY